MMQLGGEAKRNELLSKINSNKISSSFDAMNLGGSVGYTDEDKQIMAEGDIGQGERLAAAQRNRKK